MMGGSGGGSRYGAAGRDAGRLAAEARRRLQRQELLAEVNDYLNDLLRSFNDRDSEGINDRINAVVDSLGDDVGEVDRLLFGGSVAKHTYVNGLSDVDALMVMRGVNAESPGDLVGALARTLRRAHLTDVVDVAAGDLAVTVTYSDGSQLQLLPAQEANGRLRIASEDGQSWREIRPRRFAAKLTQVNRANAGGVVPAVKLAKAALQQLPESHQLSGYHIEAIAVDAFKNYNGPRNRQAMFRHVLEHAASAVLNPTGDITGQSVHIDSHLGASNSDVRRAVSRDIGRIVRKIDAATSVADYRDIVGD